MAAHLTMVDQHCLRLVDVAPHPDTLDLPWDVENRNIRHTWDKECIVDWGEDPCMNEELCPIELSEQYF